MDPKAIVSIEAYVRRAFAATEEELRAFVSLLEARHFPKKSLVFAAGEICTFEGYIVNGCLRTYILDERGAERVLAFAVEDWWFGDLTSFYEQRPSRITVETIEACDILLMPIASKERLLLQYPRFERMYRIMLQRSVANVYNRLFDTMAKPAKERYQDFLERYPQIPNRVPQHLIASYLGISPEFLSKIRSEMRL